MKGLRLRRLKWILLMYGAIVPLKYSFLAGIEYIKSDYPYFIYKNTETREYIIFNKEGKEISWISAPYDHPNIIYTIKKEDTLDALIRRFYDLELTQSSSGYGVILLLYNINNGLTSLNPGNILKLPYTIDYLNSGKPIMRDIRFEMSLDNLNESLKIQPKILTIDKLQKFTA